MGITQSASGFQMFGEVCHVSRENNSNEIACTAPSTDKFRSEILTSCRLKMQIASARYRQAPLDSPLSQQLPSSYHSTMGALEEILKTHTDNGGDLRSVPTKLLNDAINSGQHFTAHECGIMYMLVCQKKFYSKNSARVTTLQQWITTFERRPISSTASDTESETSIQAELKAEERKLWRRIAAPAPVKKITSEEERERWRRIEEPSPSPEVEGRKRKR
jgi:hypothetical protein